MAIRCQSVVGLLPEYEAGRISGLLEAGLRLHLSVCGDCGLYVRQLQNTPVTLGALQSSEAPTAETKARLMEQFRAWRASGPKKAP